jgi:hypothetical protein
MSLTWESKEFSIASFYNKLSSISTERIDCDPVGQRPDAESMSKKQGIIDTVIRGYDFGELKLRKLVKSIDNHYSMRSIDGGHRKRAVRDFIDNKFKTNRSTIAYINDKEIKVGGMYYKDLPIEVKEQINAYKMRFTIYGQEMTDEQAGETFRRTNITTDVNHQEMLNSYENNLVAKFVREISRPIRDLNNKLHPLFEYRDMTPENRKQMWFQAASTRLRDDEFVTRFLTLLTKDLNDANWLTCSNRETENVFTNLGDKENGTWALSPAEAKKNQKAVVDALDFMLDYVKAKKSMSRQLMSPQEFTVVSRFYIYMNKIFGKNGYKVKDWNELYISIRGAMDRFVGKDPSNLRLELWADDKGSRSVCTAFHGYLTVHDKQVKSEQSIKWLLEEMDINDCGILFLDPVRVFSPEIVEQVLREQGYKCWVTGEPLSIKDAVGGHIIAHSVGGRTIKDNCMVCHKDENTNMGSMDAIAYRQIRREQLVTA